MIKKIFKILIYAFAAIGFILTAGFFAVKFGLTNNKGIIDVQQKEFISNGKIQEKHAVFYTNAPWMKSDEWMTFEQAVIKDRAVIDDVAAKTDVSPRIIVSVLAVEQLRLFFTERPVFKEIFSPLKILGTQSQFSWGVMGIKPDTAKQIEIFLKDKNSPFYPGLKYEGLLDFKTADTDTERFQRMTDYKDRNYSYLYGTLNIKEIISEWQKSGIDISNSPGIIGTLFNIGFNNSKPNSNPQIGGAEIDIDNIKYSFGSLAHDVYYSDKLLDVFPR